MPIETKQLTDKINISPLVILANKIFVFLKENKGYAYTYDELVNKFDTTYPKILSATQRLIIINGDNIIRKQCVAGDNKYPKLYFAYVK